MFKVVLVLALLVCAVAQPPAFYNTINAARTPLPGKYTPSYVETFQPKGEYILTYPPNNRVAVVAALGANSNGNNTRTFSKAYLMPGDAVVLTANANCRQINLNSVAYCLYHPWSDVMGRTDAYNQVDTPTANDVSPAKRSYGANRAYKFTSRILKRGDSALY